MEKKKKDSIWTKFTTWVLITVIVLVGIICFFPMWFTQSYWSGLDFSETGPIGDTIGGIMGPFIAIVAAGLTFIAFWVQYEANQQQRKDIKLERFESRFYEMLRLHKENVNEISKINKDGVVKNGRQLFNTMYREFEVCYLLLKEIYQGLKENEGYAKYHCTDDLIRYAYAFFYTGVGQGNRAILKAMIGNDRLVEKTRDYLIDLQNSYTSDVDFIKIDLLKKYNLNTFYIDYKPFFGYIVGHYYRHLYQTVKFIDDQDFLEYKDKYKYTKMLRAQLTDFEQAMFYFNVISGFGIRWLDKPEKEDYCLLIKYKMIHNAIPKLLELDICISPYFHSVISSQIKLWEQNNNQTFFEWYE